MQRRRRYAELHCTTNFSFLQGGSHPEELVSQAAALGYTSLAITDRASLSVLYELTLQQKNLAST